MGDRRRDQCTSFLDAPHDVKAIREVIGGRRVLAIVCTHAHDDHVRVARELADAVDTIVLLHPDDLVLWHQVHSLPPGGGAEGRAAAAGGGRGADGAA